MVSKVGGGLMVKGFVCKEKDFELDSVGEGQKHHLLQSGLAAKQCVVSPDMAAFVMDVLLPEAHPSAEKFSLTL